MQVSPDKGIAYCFACNSGGDIFSFYQKIEGVDFRQALKDLGEKTGVKIEGLKMEPAAKKDHKVRLHECLEAAMKFYQQQLSSSESAKQYLIKRGIPAEQIEEFGLGVAPDSFSDTYQHLLKVGFSRNEIVDASLGIQKDISEGKIYDRFRNRLMFPIYDGGGKMVGFGGRTLGEDDAKYINSGETPIYNKSNILYGLNLAKEAIRKSKAIILVEGYFDVLACHRIGIQHVVAVSGTALTEQHVKMIKRYAEKVILCLDQDRAGEQAAERAFYLCSEQGIPVHAVALADKDPDEAAAADPEALKHSLEEGGKPYLDLIIEKLGEQDTESSEGKHEALRLLLPLLQAVQSSVEQGHYISKVAVLLSTTETALKEDIAQMKKAPVQTVIPDTKDDGTQEDDGAFSSAEIALGLFFLFPTLVELLAELIEPEEQFGASLYNAIKELPEGTILSIDSLTLHPEIMERVSILILFCERHGFSDWSESMAAREVKRNCQNANKTLLKHKQLEIAQKLQKARAEGNTAEETQLSTQYSQVLKLAKMAST
jgi:DNA primase